MLLLPAVRSPGFASLLAFAVLVLAVVRAYDSVRFDIAAADTAGIALDG